MKKQKYIIISLLLIAITILYYNIVPSSDYGMRMMGILGIIQLIVSIYSWKKITGSALNPYIIFLISAYIFTFGQSFLFVFDKVDPERDLTNTFAPRMIIPAQFFTLIFLNCFNIGGILSCKNRTFKNPVSVELTYQEEHNRCNQINGIKRIGMLFLCLSIVPYLIERISLFYIIISTGYSGLYAQEIKIGISNILSILSQYYVPGVLCLLLTETKKSKRNFYILLLVFEACFWLFTGGRSNGVIIASILLMYYHICIKPIKLKQAIIICVAGFFFISLLSVISETRSDPNANVMQVIAESLGSSNAFYSAISEMGGSMYPMITTMELVPDTYDYKYGSTYLYALSSIIPNLGFWDLHPAMKYGNMNDWLQNAMNLNYGPGFSIVAEAYINWGTYGFIIMLLLGFCFGTIFNINIRDNRNPLLLVLSFIFCFLVIKTVRNSFLATVRSIFYYVIPIYLIVVYYYKGRLNKSI